MSFYVSSGPLAGSNKLPARPVARSSKIKHGSHPQTVQRNIRVHMVDALHAPGDQRGVPAVATTTGRVPSSSSSRARISFTSPR